MKDIKILFEDDHILVLDKPSGLIVNRSDTTTGEETLQDFLEEKNKEGLAKTSREEKEFLDRAGIVHRLDKETSGIMLTAKTPEAFRALQAQFKQRTIEKMYRALSHGFISPTEGEINVPIGRLPWNRKRFGVVAGGRESQTFYKVLKQFKKDGQELSFVELYPKTGRTHQIRVHLQHLGFPIFGDLLYAGRKTSRNDRKAVPRVFLHASKISFTHPVTLKELTFESRLPSVLESYLV